MITRIERRRHEVEGKTESWLQEELQKEAFEALQCQKDARHKRITSQISLIERELAELTMLEIEQRDMRLDTQMVCAAADDDSGVNFSTSRNMIPREMIPSPSVSLLVLLASGPKMFRLSPKILLIGDPLPNLMQHGEEE